MKKVAVLGATGSIGKSTIDVIRQNRAFFEIALLSAHTDGDGLHALGREFPAAKLALSGDGGSRAAGLQATASQAAAGHYAGKGGLLAAIAECGADIAVNGIAGAAGLEPSLAALDAGCDLALANKETIVMAGPLVFEAARRKNRAVIPVDSEHSAIFQLLEAHGRSGLDSILLTASGGPFRTLSLAQLALVKPKDALAHPTWNMGAKITIDSATMANKGLEVIEAVRLFDVPPEKVKAVVHPQSIVHSMLRFKNGEVYAQLSKPDMRLPIQNALFYPQKGEANFGSLDFGSLTLSFEAPDEEKFPLLPLAYAAIRSGGLYPVAYNAANEEAVAQFLAGKASFTGIARAVEDVLQKDWSGDLTLEAIREADSKARGFVSL